jgi:hypothetical protein
VEQDKFEVLSEELPAVVDPHNHALVRNVFAEDEAPARDDEK